MIGRIPKAIWLPIYVVAATAVSGCQTPLTQPPGDKQVQQQIVDEREAALNELQEFQFGGGLGVWTDAESLSARVIWQQSGSDLDLKLSGPLGVGDMHLQDKADFVTLRRGKTVVTSGTSADRVIQDGLGLEAPVPVEQLKQWVRGLAGNGRSITRDKAGRLSDLRYTDQIGALWSVRFKRYVSVGELSLPELITASGGEYSVRLLLKNWELNANSVLEDANQQNKRLSIPGR
ncbi:MAG: lipoprotein insertase outer membrane protein LolB [Granulosicoccus sp.]